MPEKRGSLFNGIDQQNCYAWPVNAMVNIDSLNFVLSLNDFIHDFLTEQ